jgi:hypothetical protein
MAKIAVLTPTVRPEGLGLIEKSLKQQRFREFLWVVCSPEEPQGVSPDIWIKDDFEGGFWSLNRAYNAMFRMVKQVPLCVSWQDWIYAKPDGLHKFWTNWDALHQGNQVISGVGHQYDRLDEYGKPTHQIWTDPRITDKYGSFYECNWNDAEWNFCAIPTELVFRLGGLDEELDMLGFGGDQLQLSERMNDVGTKFFLDQTNQSYTLRHTREKHGGEENWNDNHVLFNGKYDQRKKALKQKGEWPILSFLK